MTSYKIAIKIIIGSGIIYFWYLFLSQKIGYEPEQQSWDIIIQVPSRPSTNKNIGIISWEVIKTIVIDALQSDSHNTSNVSYTIDQYDQLCKQHQDICDMIVYTDDPSLVNKTRYLAIMIYIINHIDQYLYTDKKIINSIDTITIHINNLGRRGMAWNRTIVFNMWKIKSNKEFIWVVIHELNHIVDLNVLEWTLNKLNNDYTEFWEKRFAIDDHSLNFYKISWKNEKTMRPWIWFKDFVSWYSLTDPFEDFAESANLYLNHYNLFLSMARSNTLLAKKFKYMHDLYKSKMIAKWKILQQFENDLERRTRDTTTIWIWSQ
jgi:hypothetical protein